MTTEPRRFIPWLATQPDEIQGVDISPIKKALSPSDPVVSFMRPSDVRMLLGGDARKIIVFRRLWSMHRRYVAVTNRKAREAERRARA